MDRSADGSSGEAEQTLASDDASTTLISNAQLAAPGSQGPIGEPGAAEDARITAEVPGRYQLRGEKGRGGQSVVHLAYDEHIGREIALKQLLPDPADGGTAQVSATAPAALRFLREARITGQLEHPNIVPVYDLGRR